MSVADQINRIKTNIANTYTAAQAKGATMPQTQNSDNLATCVQSITTGGGGGGTQFGLTISDVLGTVDDTGAVSRTTISNALDFSGITSFTNYGLSGKFMYSMFSPSQDVEFPDLASIDNSGMYYAFQNCYGITSASFPALTTIGLNGMSSAFSGCSGITSVSFPVLASIGDSGMSSAFQNCYDGITSVSFPVLTTIGDSGMSFAFSGCSGLTSVSFPVLASIGQNGMNSAFRNCEKLESISFPELTQVTSPFNNYTFNGCDALTEIHFRADMQATIEALPGYADKFGATNATIYFSL